MNHPTRILASLTLLLTGLGVLPAPAGAAPRPAHAQQRTAHRQVAVKRMVFTLYDVNNTSMSCTPDAKQYHVHAHLIGPRGPLGIRRSRVNILVHGLGTGGWLWQLPGHRSVGYASRLARHGETSLVIDQLGYGQSPMRAGSATCLGAQADMLHQIVSKLHARGTSQTVVHAHGTGAGVAELEDATWDDVQGLVLMSWSDSGASDRARSEATAQTRACLLGADYASYAATSTDFEHDLFASAAQGVRRTAVAHHHQDPCGDARSLQELMLDDAQASPKIELPVLLLYGSRDVLETPGAPAQQAEAYGAASKVTLKVIRGAGNALPLERQAPAVRHDVLSWLHSSLRRPPA